MSEPLFKTAHQALTFAYNFSASTLDRPLMNRMADKHKREGKGLAGFDGAAQAGMILRILKTLPRLQQMILIARFAPQGDACKCCGGPVPSLLWMGAIREISDAAVTQALSGHITMRVLRDGIVARYFGQKVHLQTLVKKANVAPNTATKQNSQIIAWLRGTRITRKGEIREDGVKGVEQVAMDAAEALLFDAGIIGS
ncbi:hypothetical protein ACMHYO_16170 [Allopusillimonas ginsengisoli]|uniref:hypothetical protein n=1 Tax=Allopusillimonas ginsengisoli TaxID=453575 RepID=UPI0039C4E2AE